LVLDFWALKPVSTREHRDLDCVPYVKGVVVLTLQGSFAALIQSWIGNVPRYGIFSFLQSAGMNGYGSAGMKYMMRFGATILLKKMVAR
jgi:hypothetical protein